MGVNDDYTYFATARTLAATGHLRYYGTNAMLGVQAFVGAACIKLFGPSFLAVRLSVFAFALSSTVLLQRVMLRCGLNSWNATLTTLTFVLSPIYLPLTFSFMTDGPGLFCFVLVLYCCLRALHAPETRGSAGWLIFAAASNVILGTVRQTAWLGVIVMVPCAAWLLRKRRGIWPIAAATWVISLGCIFLLLHWFHHQLHTLPEPLVPGRVRLDTLRIVSSRLLRNALGLSLFLLPVLVAFVARSPWRLRPLWAFTMGLFIAGVGGFLVIYRHARSAEDYLEPLTANYATKRGALDFPMLMGQRPIILHESTRLALTLVTIASLLSTFLVLLRRRHAESERPLLHEGSNYFNVLVLLVPLTTCYLLLLLPRLAFVRLYDRYLITPFLCLLILLTLHYQDTIKTRLPAVSIVVLAIFSTYAIASLHDAYSLYRGRLEAINTLRHAGVLPAAILGGYEYDALVRIENEGYDPVLEGTAGKPNTSRPKFLLSFDPNLGAGPSRFGPVEYDTWLAPHHNYIYIQRP